MLADLAAAHHNLAALVAIGRRLGLDCGGVDFPALANGRLPVFEANASMPVQMEHECDVLPSQRGDPAHPGGVRRDAVGGGARPDIPHVAFSGRRR